MRFDDGKDRERAYDWDELDEAERPWRPPIAPGKRTLTMNLPPGPPAAAAGRGAGIVPAPIQFATGAAHDATHVDELAVRGVPTPRESRPAAAALPAQTRSRMEGAFGVDFGSTRIVPESRDVGSASGRQRRRGAEPIAPGKRTLTIGLQPTEPAGGEVPHRAQMERSFGEDFSKVRAHLGEQEHLRSLGAEAAADGETVAFASSSPSPWLVAHELTHVVQSRIHGAAEMNRKATISEPASAAEREADAVADRVAAGGAAGEIREAPGAVVQRFSPEHHEQATIAGLSETFSQEEIAAIYAANWERDFSQGPAKIASAAIAWSAVKRAAASYDAGAFEKKAEAFKDAIWKVITMDPYEAAFSESLGEYHYWEHMDQPTRELTSPSHHPGKDAEDRWNGKSDGLAGYILDAKAYIKDHMVAAIDVCRSAGDEQTIGANIDNWGDVDKPSGYVAPWYHRGRYDRDVASREPIRLDTVDRAAAAGAQSVPPSNPQMPLRLPTGGDAWGDAPSQEANWFRIGDLLGRAMHAFEDFWAHSNWLELAQELQAKRERGSHDEGVSNDQLFTGTFGMAAKTHALGHKLLALSSAFLSDEGFELLLEIYDRAKDTEIHPIRQFDLNLFLESRSFAWGLLSHTPVGEMLDIAAATNMIRFHAFFGLDVADVLCNRSWLEALQDKARRMIEQGSNKSGPHSHGTIAKDQHEPGRDHAGALELAAEANRQVFGPLRAIMTERDPAQALAALQSQLALVDDMLRAPSLDHPLWPLISRVCLPPESPPAPEQ